MTKKELDHVIIDYVDCEFHIKKVDGTNRLLINKVQLIEQKYHRKNQMADKGLISNEAMRELTKRKVQEMAAVYAEYVVVGWKGVLNGKKLPKFSKEACAEVLGDPANDALFGDLIQTSVERENFEVEQDEAEEKN